MSINRILYDKPILNGIVSYVDKNSSAVQSIDNTDGKLTIDRVGANVTINLNSSSSSFITANEIYVAKNGNDSTGNGSIINPFQTIQHAINQTTSYTSNTLIHIGTGTYSENLAIGNGYVHLVAGLVEANNINEVVVIDGNILVNIGTGADDLINRNVSLNGLQIKGYVQDFSNKLHTLLINSCSISTNSGACLFLNCINSNCKINDCEISHLDSSSGSPVVRIWGGNAYFNRSDIYAKSANHCIDIQAFGLLAQCNLCLITSSNSSPTGLINITNNNSIHNITLTTFTFTDGTSKTNAGGAYAVYSSSALTPVPSLFIRHCYFNLIGLVSGNNCIGGNLSVVYGDNLSVPGLASGINTTSKTAFSVVA